jgi:NAD(P)-dependent dehydrogenase (short-subunit alcohol dehydrogenase family)
MAGQFSGKVAFVTGAASGIGHTVAGKLAAAGAVVVGADLTPGQDGVRLDVSDAEAVAEAIAAAEARHGRIDILVNSAGVGVRGGGILEMGLDDWRRAMAVNLDGTLATCRAALPGMVARGAGAVVNVGSTFGLAARPQSLAYAVSKAAVIHLTKCIALDVARSGVRVNCVCPGLIDTPLVGYLAAAPDALRRANIQAHAMDRLGRPDEVADAILYLASDAASFITGETLAVDGGYTAGKWPATPPYQA